MHFVRESESFVLNHVTIFLHKTEKLKITNCEKQWFMSFSFCLLITPLLSAQQKSNLAGGSDLIKPGQARSVAHHNKQKQGIQPAAYLGLAEVLPQLFAHSLLLLLQGRLLLALAVHQCHQALRLLPLPLQLLLQQTALALRLQHLGRVEEHA